MKTYERIANCLTIIGGVIAALGVLSAGGNLLSQQSSDEFIVLPALIVLVSAISIGALFIGLGAIINLLIDIYKKP